MEPIIINTSRKKAITYFVFLFGVLGLALYNAALEGTYSTFELLPGAIVTLSTFTFLIPVFSKRAVYLEISDKGMYEKNLFLRNVFYTWDEVDNFCVVKASYFNKFVGFHCSNPQKAKKVFSHKIIASPDNSDTNAMLAENYGMPADELAKLLQEKKDEYTRMHT